MNWKRHEVSSQDLGQLLNHNEPILLSSTERGLFTPNAGVELYSADGRQTNAIYDADLGAIRKLNAHNPIFSSMRNRDLLLYNDLLLNESVNTIIVDGLFGTGKTSTLCSHLVPGMLKDLRGESGGIPYAHLVKPHVSMGNSYGFLPGNLRSKTYFEYQSFTQYFDRFGQPGLADLLMMSEDDSGRNDLLHRRKEKTLDDPGFNIQEPVLHTLVFEYMRGRDIEDGWIVLDEAQNTSNKEMSGFLSRPGDKAKVVVLGDTSPYQIDLKGNSPDSNGLKYAKDVYIGKKYAGYVSLRTRAHILRGNRAKDLYDSLQLNT